MKKIVLALCTALALVSCAKDPTILGPHHYTGNGISVDLAKADWYTTRDNTTTNVYLDIAGSTNADRVVIRSVGDGLATDNSLQLTPDKNFMDTVGIAFTHGQPQGKKFQMSTQMTAYKGTDSLKVTLYSGELMY